MFSSEPKFSLRFLILAVLAVGITAFFVGQFFAGRESAGDYIALTVEEVPEEIYEPSEIEEFAEPCEVPTAVAIYVHCPFEKRYRREALMSSMEDALEVRHLMALRYLTPDIVDYWFYPDLRLMPVEINDDANLHTPRDAFIRLSRIVLRYVEHEIAPDETLDEIAYAWDMEAYEILRINGLTEESPLEPGQRIWVLYIGPLIYVFTVEKAWEFTPLHHHVEIIYVYTLPRFSSRIVQFGRDGHHAIEKRITRKGTEIIDKVATSREIVSEPVPMIQEVGL